MIRLKNRANGFASTLEKIFSILFSILSGPALSQFSNFSKYSQLHVSLFPETGRRSVRSCTHSHSFDHVERWCLSELSTFNKFTSGNFSIFVILLWPLLINANRRHMCFSYHIAVCWLLRQSSLISNSMEILLDHISYSWRLTCISFDIVERLVKSLGGFDLVRFTRKPLAIMRKGLRCEITIRIKAR